MQMMRQHDGNFGVLESQPHIEIANRIVEHLTVLAPSFHCSKFILEISFKKKDGRFIKSNSVIRT